MVGCSRAYSIHVDPLASDVSLYASFRLCIYPVPRFAILINDLWAAECCVCVLCIVVIVASAHGRGRDRVLSSSAHSPAEPPICPT